MIKKLSKHGNSKALVIDRPVLDLLKIDDDTPLEITTDGKVLVITPVRDTKRRKRFEKALLNANTKYARALKRLAEETVEPDFLTLGEILAIHQDQINKYGGKSGVRDMGLLMSAAAQPEAAFDGKLLHEDLHSMAAAYLFHITQNHPFLDGNKRAGAVAAYVFLALNHLELTASEEDYETLVMGVASGKIKKVEAAEFFRANTKGLSK